MKHFILPKIKYFILPLAFLLIGALTVNAQFTLNTTVSSTGYTGINGAGNGFAITFVIENTSAQSVILTDVGDWTDVTDNGATFSLYYSSTSLSGAPPTAYPATGWTLASQNTVSGITSTTLGVNNVISNMNLIIPSNTSYRFALFTTGACRYSGSGVGSCTPNTFTNSGVSLYVGDYQINTLYVGYGSSNSPRFFTGSVSFIPATPCSGTPLAGTASGPIGTVCANNPFSLNLTGFTLASGVSYQWQSKATSGSVWSNISGATSSSYNQTSGITVATDYRAIVTCAGSSLSDTSNVVSVTVAPLFPAGTYTINPSLPTSGANFQTMAAAVSAISCGISGPIIFNMAAGNTFNEQVTLPSTIGTTAANTITFNGNGDTLNFTGSALMPWTIGLDGADYITFNNLVVTGNGTYSLVAHLWNDADHNNFNNCTFIAPANGSSTTQIPFSVSGSPTSGTTTGNSGSYNVLDSCTIISGYYNTVFYGNSAIPSVGNQVKNSTLQDFYTYGSYNLYQSGMLIKNNTIERPTRTTLSSFYGIYFSTGVVNSTMEQNRITNQFGGNPIYSGTSYNIYVTSTTATAGNENKVINNVIGNINGNSSAYGIYMPSAIYTQVYYNTISIDNTSATTGTVYGIYSTGTTGGIDIRNNNISITQGGSGTKYALYFSTSALGKTCNYNNIYIGSTSGINNVGYLSSAQATLANWQAAGGGVFDQNSVSLDPMFISATSGNFTPSNVNMNNLGTPIAGITTDFLGNTRSATVPDIGAYEFTVSGCTVPPTPGAAQTSAPSVCNGQSINLELIGNSAGLGQTYQWKSGTSVTGPWTNIGTPQTSPILANVTPAGGTTTYYVCDVTCGISTATSTVDYVTVPQAFPGGTYTINPLLPTGGANFQTMAAAVSAISCGISGAVIFNMAAGNTFNEQVTLPETIGATTTNTVTFNGNGDTINYTGSATMPWTIGLDGADYITFNNLVVTGNGTYSLVTHLWNDADHNNFNNCSFIAPENGSSTTQIPFSVSGSPTSGTITGNSGSYNVLDSCTIISGYYNTVFYGDSGTPSVGNEVKNSTLQDFYIYGSYNNYQSDMLIKNNTVERPTRTTMSTFYGIYFSTGVTNSTMEQNRITNQFGGNPTYAGTSYNIYVSSTSATAGNENRIINNVLGNFNGNGSAYGIYMPSAIYTQVYYNTISIDNIFATTGAVYGIYSSGTTGGIDIKNNNISITQGGNGIKYALYFSSSAAGKTCNYNNIYIGSTSGTNNIGYLSSAQATFAAWQAAGGSVFDQNSTNVDPMFALAASGNFTPSNAGMNDLGTPITGITTDFLNTTRSTTTPDMGAYEFSVIPCSGTVTAGVANGPLSKCSGQPTLLEAVGATAPAGGLSGNWQSSTSPTGPWVNIAGAVTPSYNLGAGITAVTSFRYWMSCSNNSSTDTSNVITITLNPANQCYCIPPPSTLSGLYWINSVSTTGGTVNFSNLNTGQELNSYGDYTNMVVGVNPSDSFEITVLAQAGASPGIKIWVDWNQNGIFDTNEEVYASSAGTSSTLNTYTSFIVAPTTALQGTTRMRVRNYTNITPCDLQSYGEAEDYTVQVGSGCIVPVVNLGADTTICSGQSLTLDAGNTGLDFLWNDNSTNQTLTVTSSGTYTVTVTDSACSASDTIVVNVTTMPVVNFGNDTTICAGQTLTLNATNAGSTYLWSNSTTGPTLNVTTAGTYSVKVTKGICIAKDTIAVSIDPLPSADMIDAVNAGGCNFTFRAVNAENATSYSWTFGDGSPNDTNAVATHAYAGNGSYLSVLVMTNDCGTTTITKTIECSDVGIRNIDLSKDALKLYPNPTSDKVTIENTSNLNMEYVTVFNVLGQVVYQAVPQSAVKHQMNVSKLASGLYTVRIKTNEGMVIRKFEILK